MKNGKQNQLLQDVHIPSSPKVVFCTLDDIKSRTPVFDGDDCVTHPLKSLSSTVAPVVCETSTVKKQPTPHHGSLFGYHMVI